MKAIQYDVQATLTFKDITWVAPDESHEPLLDELAALKVADATKEMLADELKFLNKPEELGGFQLEVAVTNPIDVTAALEAALIAED